MAALVKRNLLLYFRNRSGVFFSLLGAMISFVLYIIFLKKSMLSNWQQVADSQQLLDLWLIGGTLSVTAITTTFTSLGQLVKDKERGVIQDFYLTALSHFKIKISYMLSAALIGFLMQLMMLILMMGYFAIVDKLVIQWRIIPLFCVVSLLSAVLAVVINMLFVQFINRVDSLGSLGTVIGTASGFLVGTYVPIGSLPHFAQLLVKLTPGAYIAAIYRQMFMTDKLRNIFGNQRSYFESFLGVKLKWVGLLSGFQTIQLVIIILIIGILMLFLINSSEEKSAKTSYLK
ncbi:ABC transporter permease [Lentilactobacillus farraginis]|uniref:ABC transporter permease n=1 Tax=Lentilactobacillus farraginis DSM 18382 = JCM 14108 TaxID=1423743 RepID=X0PFW5_9LACO|nr:ABC transporter permease [Lentilactobacillus farraginis]KRM08379.1 ABC transporter permease [Lentilactobacillus farraginis DSM 18382 = JCM 14108]GAF35822.1 putative ABC transporter, integral membrane protein [Lentilactobacillus farraginis DSM 18382 = JCM 14108]